MCIRAVPVGFGSGFWLRNRTVQISLASAAQYVGLEYDSPENRTTKNADIYYDGQSIPLEDASINGILSTQTLEHIPNPARIVEEWARIMQPGGYLLLTIPLMWPEHEMPYDFQRYTTNGIRTLLENNGFEIVSQERLLCDCRAPAQLFLAWLYDVLKLGSRPLPVRLAGTAVLFCIGFIGCNSDCGCYAQKV